MDFQKREIGWSLVGKTVAMRDGNYKVIEYLAGYIVCQCVTSRLFWVFHMAQLRDCPINDETGSTGQG